MKRKILKVTGIILLALVVVVLGLLTYVKTALPNVGDAPEIKVPVTPEAVKRGEYLARHVAMCEECHSTRDFSLFAGPVTPGTEGGGGEAFDQQKGLPGVYHAKNLTPYALGKWTDGEIYRAITAGVSKDGKALFPIMDYPAYGQMDDKDIYAIIAYLRTLPSIQKDIPASTSDVPMNFIINTIPKKGKPQPVPDKQDIVKYGKYLTDAAGCAHCHTLHDNKGNPVGEPFAGGTAWKLPAGTPHLPNGTIRVSNITPDVETGIGSWSEETFVQKFKSYLPDSLKRTGDGEFNTIMAWSAFAGMETDDLKAIYAYLRTLKPARNPVVRWTPGNQ